MSEHYIYRDYVKIIFPYSLLTTSKYGKLLGFTSHAPLLGLVHGKMSSKKSEHCGQVSLCMLMGTV